MIERTLGASLRRIREQNGVSLRNLAEKATISPSFLSQIENGQSSPSISSMEKILAALGVTLGEFFASANARPVNVMRASERAAVALDWSKAAISSFGSLPAGSQLEVSMVSIRPGGITGKHPTPSLADELAILFEGNAVVCLDTDEQTLGRGDAAMIRAGTPRQWRNETDKETEILVISVRREN
jgi:XRE family transcriptional regulator, regulator of sulfur utilization